MEFTEQFLDIFLDIYWKVDLLRDAQKKEAIDAFRLE
jgi:hypothetical protein